MKNIDDLRRRLQQGLCIPAHPLALNQNRRLDERHQRALTRYYLAAGSGGVAVGVHTTQFGIHFPEVGLYKPVLELAAEECQRVKNSQEIVKVAGIIGDTTQALREAQIARDLGYHCGLLGLGTLKDEDENTLIRHSEKIARIIPIFGFYLQPAVGGRVLSYDFWRRFVEIENIVAIKMAPFNRYYTNDVVRAVCDSGRVQEISLYTGNDDNIVVDLITPYSFTGEAKTVSTRIVGGLLGHWAVWTRESVQILGLCKSFSTSLGESAEDLLELNIQVTDSNAAFFDVANQFAGCIAGIHEVLRRQGLLDGIWCLDPEEGLSPGQSEEIDRVYSSYPHLNDDLFVQKHLDEWLS